MTPKPIQREDAPMNALAIRQEVRVASRNEALLSGRAGELVDAVNRAYATDEESLSKCVDLLKLVKDLGKKVDDERRLIVDPLNQVVKHVNSRFKCVTEPLLKAETTLKGKILERQRIVEREAREEAARRQRELETKALEEAAKKEKEGDVIGAEVQMDRIERTIVRPLAVTGPTQGAMTGAKSSITKKWTYRITDIAALASARPECVAAQQTVIMTLFRAGVKDIPGVEFFQEESISVR